MAGPPLPLGLLHAAARLMTKVGKPTRPAWKWSEKPGEMPADRSDLLTHDGARYADELWWREHAGLQGHLDYFGYSRGWAPTGTEGRYLTERRSCDGAAKAAPLLLST